MGSYFSVLLSILLGVAGSQALADPCYGIEEYRWDSPVLRSLVIEFRLEGLNPEWAEAIRQASNNWNSAGTGVSLRERATDQQGNNDEELSYFAVGQYPEVLERIGVGNLRYEREQEYFDKRIAITMPFHHFDPKTKQNGPVKYMVTVFDASRGWSFDGDPKRTEYDAETAAMHEFGHWFLLKDLMGEEATLSAPFASAVIRSKEKCGNSIMWWQINPGKPRRQLDKDDIEGVRTSFSR